MKLGLSTDSFTTAISSGRMNLAKIVDFASQNGFQGLEIVNRKEVWRKEIGDDVKMNLTRIREKRIRYYSHCVNRDLCIEDDKLRWMTMNKIREAIMLSCTTSMPDVCVLGSGTTEKGMEWGRAKELLVAGIKDCIDLAEKKRVIVCLENCGTLFNGSERLLEVVKEVGSENLKVNLDIAAFLLVEEEPADAVRTLQGNIRNVDFTDAKNAEDYENENWVTSSGRQLMPCALGEGIVSQREVLYTLKQIDFDGYVSVLYQGSEEPAVGVDKSASYLKTMLREINNQ